MSAFTSYDVQKAIDALLIANSQLLTKLGTGDSNSIYDAPDQALTRIMPYIVYSSLDAIPFDTKTSNGLEVFINISVFDETRNKEKISQIKGLIYDTLQNAELSVNGNTVILCQLDNDLGILLDDTTKLMIYQGMLRFRVLTSE